MDDLRNCMGDNEAEDFYEILGLTAGASEAEIQKAHYRMARAWHPDKHRGSLEATEHFKLIQRAADVLRDPEARLDYDMQECIHRLAAEDYIDKAGPRVTLTASGLGLSWQSPGGHGVAFPWGRGSDCGRALADNLSRPQGPCQPQRLMESSR